MQLQQDGVFIYNNMYWNGYLCCGWPIFVIWFFKAKAKDRRNMRHVNHSTKPQGLKKSLENGLNLKTNQPVQWLWLLSGWASMQFFSVPIQIPHPSFSFGRGHWHIESSHSHSLCQNDAISYRSSLPVSLTSIYQICQKLMFITFTSISNTELV